MVDIEKLKALAEKASKGFGSCSPAEWMEFRELSGRPTTVLELIAELKELRRRAAYWKQRAKSAEGHLYLSDWVEARKALHQHTELSRTPWDELTDSQRAKVGSATAAVLRVIDQRRDVRRPAGGE